MRCTASFLLLVVLLLVGCDDRSEYEKLVERELATGEEHNRLFLGYELGMAKEEFYDRSWALNRKELVMQGPRNQTVQYELDDELRYPAKMYYYPDFFDEKIFQMRVRFMYDGWAPWNRHLMADSLQQNVVKLLEDWYGGGFLHVDGADGLRREGDQYIKVDGNRRIVVTEISDSEVVVVFTDLIAERKIEAQKQQ